MFKFFFKSTVYLLLALFVAGGYGYWWAHQPLKFSPRISQASGTIFHVPAGYSLRQATQVMKYAGVQIQATHLLLLARLKKVDTGIKAGSYELKEGTTPIKLLEQLSQGKTKQDKIRLIEGKTLKQWRQIIYNNPTLRHDSRIMSDSELAQALGIQQNSVEGWLFPDTYFFDRHSSDLEILQRSYITMQKSLKKAWINREPNLPYTTPYQALIMASIIEKETGHAKDRAKIAAVLINRLKQGMSLQTDPTVIYGLGELFNGNLQKWHLKMPTPYNTYTISGLPPTPIAMVSEASLHAALHPAHSDALYFVSRGDGSSQFSRSLQEHNKAVKQYQLTPRNKN